MNFKRLKHSILEPNNNGLFNLMSWVIGAIAGLIIIVVVFSNRNTNFNDVTLAKGTITFRASVNGYQIHCEDERDASLCIDGVSFRGKHNSVLWLGNSQLHAINQFKKGDLNAVPLLHDMLFGHGMDLIAFSQPNANLQEHSVVFTSLLSSLPIKTLIMPIVFDDTREDGIRQELISTLHKMDVTSVISNYAVGTQMLRINKPQTGDADTGAIRQTMQEIIEQKLTKWFESHSSFWLSRPEVRGSLFLALYELRNAVFQIKPETARPLIPSRYRVNMDALRMVLDIARKSNVRVILYIAPIRNDVGIPYLPDQYQSFKVDVIKLANEYNVKLLNLESLVPAEYWGTKDGTSLDSNVEIDFMHFQAAGHRLLAQKIGAEILSRNLEKDTNK
jgi:hypothetical protein